MIEMTLEEVKSIIEEERQLYIPQQFKRMKRTHQKRYLIWKTLVSFRMWQYWQEQRDSRNLGRVQRYYAKLSALYYFRQRNLYTEKSGVEISNRSVLGRRLNIWHGGVVISGRLGDDCVIHGNNIIGNKGDKVGKTPTIGDRVDIGAGAVIIGGISVANDCVIGANAVVNKDFLETGSLIIGVPAYSKGK